MKNTFFLSLCLFFPRFLFGQDNINYKAFEALPRKVILSFGLVHPQFCAFTNSPSNKNLLELKSFIKREDKLSNNSEINLIHKLSFLHQKDTVEVVKYTISNSIKNNVIVLKKNIVLTKIGLSTTLYDIAFVIKSLKNEKILWAFIDDKKTNYPEIDLIKEKFKDENFTLNLSKLGVYLRTKPKEMEKYCDF